MSDHAPRSSRPHRTRKIILTIVIVPIALFAALLVAGFVLEVFQRSDNIRNGNYSLNAPSSSVSTESAYTGDQKKLIEGQNNNWLGAENPKVTVVEFSDFACPFCKASFPAMRELGVRYKDSVKIIFRDWPAHDNSIALTMGAYCAGEQGKFWDMHDKLFQYQSDTFGSNKNDITALAQQLGIDNDQFQNCVDTQKYLPQIRANFRDSQTLGVRGTPTWYINGEKIEGARTVTELEQLISSHLN